jgi:uncharacterized protein YndB with AHSA1/START domain
VTSDDALVVEFEVGAPVAHAFAVWTTRAGLWWPKGHTVSGDPASIVFEPAVGGRIVERGRDGSEHEWGEITAWDEPTQVGFLWYHVFDRSQATHVSMTFEPVGEGTHVRLVQSGFAALGPAGAERRARTTAGWGAVAGAFVLAAGGTG